MYARHDPAPDLLPQGPSAGGRLLCRWRARDAGDRNLHQWEGSGFGARDQQFAAAHPALGQKLRIDGAACVAAEAKIVTVAQAVEAEIAGASRVGTVQERAVGAGVGHVISSPGTRQIGPRFIRKSSDARGARRESPGGVGAVIGRCEWESSNRSDAVQNHGRQEQRQVDDRREEQVSRRRARALAGATDGGA